MTIPEETFEDHRMLDLKIASKTEAVRGSGGGGGSDDHNASSASVENELMMLLSAGGPASDSMSTITSPVESMSTPRTSSRSSSSSCRSSSKSMMNKSISSSLTASTAALTLSPLSPPLTSTPTPSARSRKSYSNRHSLSSSSSSRQRRRQYQPPQQQQQQQQQQKQHSVRKSPKDHHLPPKSPRVRDSPHGVASTTSSSSAASSAVMAAISGPPLHSSDSLPPPPPPPPPPMESPSMDSEIDAPSPDTDDVDKTASATTNSNNVKTKKIRKKKTSLKKKKTTKQEIVNVHGDDDDGHNDRRGVIDEDNEQHDADDRHDGSILKDQADDHNHDHVDDDINTTLAHEESKEKLLTSRSLQTNEPQAIVGVAEDTSGTTTGRNSNSTGDYANDNEGTESPSSSPIEDAQQEVTASQEVTERSQKEHGHTHLAGDKTSSSNRRRQDEIPFSERRPRQYRYKRRGEDAVSLSPRVHSQPSTNKSSDSISVSGLTTATSQTVPTGQKRRVDEQHQDRHLMQNMIPFPPLSDAASTRTGEEKTMDRHGDVEAKAKGLVVGTKDTALQIVGLVDDTGEDNKTFIVEDLDPRDVDLAANDGNRPDSQTSLGSFHEESHLLDKNRSYSSRASVPSEYDVDDDGQDYDITHSGSFESDDGMNPNDRKYNARSSRGSQPPLSPIGKTRKGLRKFGSMVVNTTKSTASTAKRTLSKIPKHQKSERKLADEEISHSDLLKDAPEDVQNEDHGKGSTPSLPIHDTTNPVDHEQQEQESLGILDRPDLDKDFIISMLRKQDDSSSSGSSDSSDSRPLFKNRPQNDKGLKEKKVSLTDSVLHLSSSTPSLFRRVKNGFSSAILNQFNNSASSFSSVSDRNESRRTILSALSDDEDMDDGGDSKLNEVSSTISQPSSSKLTNEIDRMLSDVENDDDSDLEEDGEGTHISGHESLIVVDQEPTHDEYTEKVEHPSSDRILSRSRRRRSRSLRRNQIPEKERGVRKSKSLDVRSQRSSTRRTRRRERSSRQKNSTSSSRKPRSNRTARASARPEKTPTESRPRKASSYQSSTSRRSTSRSSHRTRRHQRRSHASMVPEPENNNRNRQRPASLVDPSSSKPYHQSTMVQPLKPSSYHLPDDSGHGSVHSRSTRLGSRTAKRLEISEQLLSTSNSSYRFSREEEKDAEDPLSSSRHSTASSPVLGVDSMSLTSLTSFLRNAPRRSRSFDEEKSDQKEKMTTKKKQSRKLASIDVAKKDDDDLYANQSLEDLWSKARTSREKTDDELTSPTTNSSSSAVQLNDSSTNGSFSIRW
mmetsp:Transcript_3176/g.7267  ORF Transcript_3176/g.7267 Transcript_3176/m.7267 type:complete len:1292 (+) Transcript_3176:248-4123(+)